MGMKKRGRSCAAIAREELGMPKNTKRTDLIAALNALIEVFKN
jgi:hypothetical protein